MGVFADSSYLSCGLLCYLSCIFAGCDSFALVGFVRDLCLLLVACWGCFGFLGLGFGLGRGLD